MERIVCLVIGYIFGLFQTGYLYGKAHHVDIRKQGSGNAGTTNALRTMGWKAGAVTFLGDCFKCVFAVVVVHLLFAKNYGDILPLLSMYAGMGAVLGHNYPFYMHFKGGKGIAATAGLLVSTTNVWMVLICLVSFVLIVGVTRYVSLGSLAVVIIYCIWEDGRIWNAGCAFNGNVYYRCTSDAVSILQAQRKYQTPVSRYREQTQCR